MLTPPSDIEKIMDLLEVKAEGRVHEWYDTTVVLDLAAEAMIKLCDLLYGMRVNDCGADYVDITELMEIRNYIEKYHA